MMHHEIHERHENETERDGGAYFVSFVYYVVTYIVPAQRRESPLLATGPCRQTANGIGRQPVHTGRTMLIVVP